MYKYINNSLPRDILRLIDSSIQTSSNITRSRVELSYAPKRELQRGNLLYDLISKGNEFENLIKESKSIMVLKHKINEIQNRIMHCKKQNCYSCTLWVFTMRKLGNIKTKANSKGEKTKQKLHLHHYSLERWVTIAGELNNVINYITNV